jgi:hypothetical protein
MKGATLQTLILGLLCLAVTGLGGALYNQHQRIADLQVASVTPAQHLDTLQQDSNSLLAAQEALRHEVKALRLAVDSGAQQASTLDPLLEQWAQEIQALRDGLAARASETALAALRTRTEQVEQQLQVLNAKPPRRVPPPPAKPRKAARPLVPAPLSPPFTVLGIESRGGERFLTAAPLGSRTLAEVQLLHLGERFGSWHLKTLSPTTATFMVPNQPDQIVPLP